MRKIIGVAAMAFAIWAGPAAASTGQQNSVAYSYAMQKCSNYQGCSGVYVGQLVIYTERSGNAIYNRFYFDTRYCGRKYYVVEVWASGVAHAGSLYGGTC